MDLILLILGTMIGVALVMLLLSLLVTSIVQFVQSCIRLRSRNLQHSLAALIDRILSSEVSETKPKPGGKGKAKPPVGDVDLETLIALREPKKAPAGAAETAAFLAKDALDWANFAPPDGKPAAGPIQRLFSPEYSWLEKCELVTYLKRQGLELTEARERLLDLLFPRMEAYSKKRFLLQVRLITVAVSLLVAAAFQLNTMDLVHRLSTDPKLRQQYVDAARGVVSNERITKKAVARLELATDEALSALQERHKKDKELLAKLEMVSGEATSRAEAIKELRSVVGASPESDDLVAEYEELIDQAASKQRDEAAADVAFYTEQLALLDLRPFPESWHFYLKPLNWVGIAITTILLSFGAPFWFEMLKNILKLHDVLQPPKKKAPADEPPAGDADSVNPRLAS